MFKRRSNLSVHERTHTGEAPFRCDLCAVNFKRNHHLGAHLKTLNHSNRLKLLQAEGVQVGRAFITFLKGAILVPKKLNCTHVSHAGRSCTQSSIRVRNTPSLAELIPVTCPVWVLDVISHSLVEAPVVYQLGPGHLLEVE